MFKQKSAQRGATMVEVLGVLSVIGMISVGLMGGINSMYSQVKVSSTRTKISGIVKKARSVLTVIENVADGTSAASPHFFSTEQLVKLGIVDPIDVSGDIIASPYGGQIQVGYYVDSFAQERRLVVTFQDMPMKPCTDVMKIDWGDDSSSGLMKIMTYDAYSSTVKSEYVWKEQFFDDSGNAKSLSTGQHYLPVEYDTMMSSCHSDTKNGVDIRWEYSL